MEWVFISHVFSEVAEIALVARDVTWYNTLQTGQVLSDEIVSLIAFDRTHTTYVIFQSHGFDDSPAGIAGRCQVDFRL